MKKNENKINGLKNFARRLKEIRQELEINQTQMARKLGYTNSFLSELENGKGKPSYEFLIKLESIYNINLGWLMQGNGTMFLNHSENGMKGTAISETKNQSDEERFLWYFNNSPVFKYSVMGFAFRFLHENQVVIDRDANYFRTELKEEKKDVKAKREGNSKEQT